MTLRIPSVQSVDVALRMPLTLSLMAWLSSENLQDFSLMKRYCFDRSVAETFVESSVVAMTVVAAMYFGHVPLVGMTALWCLALFGIAAYRLLSLHSQIAQELNTNRTDTLQADADVSDAYMAALANALT